jgi:hypothetical protein
MTSYIYSNKVTDWGIVFLSLKELWNWLCHFCWLCMYKDRTRMAHAKLLGKLTFTNTI